MSSAPVTLYGLRSCDTVRKARAWLDGHGVAYRFHDVRADGLDDATLARWEAAVGRDALLNRAGTTFRQLPPDEKADLTPERARALMLAHPSLLKRPVVEAGDRVLVGFKPQLYEAAFRQLATLLPRHSGAPKASPEPIDANAEEQDS